MGPRGTGRSVSWKDALMAARCNAAGHDNAEKRTLPPSRAVDGPAHSFVANWIPSLSVTATLCIRWRVCQPVSCPVPSSPHELTRVPSFCRSTRSAFWRAAALKKFPRRLSVFNRIFLINQQIECFVLVHNCQHDFTSGYKGPILGDWG
jgi:hypothetical protein